MDYMIAMIRMTMIRMIESKRKSVVTTYCVMTLCLIGSIFSVADETYAQDLQQQIYYARDRVLPALVHIQPVISNYRTGKLVKQSIVGSGVIIHPDGYVVTNYHVAGRADYIVCTLADKEQVRAKLIGGDPPTDLAIIQLDLSDYKGKLVVADFGDSDSLQVGQQVIAMGSPLALARSITSGVISTLDRYFPEDTRLPTGERTGQYNLWVQTDAAINPGNSGGPLVDLQGRVVGINSRAQIFANNIGFSIPSNIVREVSNELIANGKVVRSWIGIHCQALQDLESWFGTTENEGALISSIDPDSPAEVAKLRAGDMILAINGQPVSARFSEQIPAVYRMIAEQKPGSELALLVQRKNERFNVLVRTQELGLLQGEDLECPNWGFAVKAITQQMALDYQLDETDGVLVSGVKRPGPGFSGGLRSGDVITKVEGRGIDNFSDFSLIYTELADTVEKGLLLTVRRGGAVRFVVVKSEKNGSETSDSSGPTKDSEK